MTDEELRRLYQQIGYDPTIEPPPLASPTPSMFPAGNPPGLPNLNNADYPGTSSPTFENFPTNPYPGPANETFPLPTLNEPTFESGNSPFFTPMSPDLGNQVYGPNYGTDIYPGLASAFDLNAPDFSHITQPTANYDFTGSPINPQTPVTPAFIQDNYNLMTPGEVNPQVPTEFPTPTENWPYGYAPGEPMGETQPFQYFPDYVNDPYDTSGGNNAPGLSYGNVGNEPVNQPAGPVNEPYRYPYFVNQFQGTSPNGILGSNPYSYGSPTSPSGPVTQGTQGMLDANGNVIPGTALSESGTARIYNTQQFPNAPGFHPGQTIVNAAGNLVDLSGRAISSAGNEARALWNNILNDPRNTDPSYLASMGYHEMGDVGSGFMIPGGVSGPSVGPNDVGTYGAINAGSYFHGGASAGMQHGATSVAGAYSGLGAGAIANLRGTSWGGALDANALRRLMRGYYTSPQSYAALSAATPYRGAPPASYNQFHQSQIQLGDILRANPSFVQNALARPSPGEAPHFGTRGGSREAILPK